MEWVAYPFSNGSSPPRNEMGSPALQADSLPSDPPGKPMKTGVGRLSLLQGIFWHRKWNGSPALQVDSLPAEPQGKPKNNGVGSLSRIQQIFPTKELTGVSCTTHGFFYQLSYQGTPKYTCELYKKVVNDLDNRDVLGTHLEPDNCTHLTGWESDKTEQLHFHFHFHALEKEMATHSSVLAWRILGTGEPGGLPSMGSHRVGHDWSNLAAAAAEHIMWNAGLDEA